MTYNILIIGYFYLEQRLKEVSITPDYKIVVYLHEGLFYAFGSKCPHKGFPLVKCVVVDKTIKCPLHGSEFDIESGVCEDYPSYEGIPTFQVLNIRGRLKVLMKETGVYSVSRPLGKIYSKQRLAVAIGSGASAVAFAQTLREGHWEGRIILLSTEKQIPYDKTRLSETVHLQAKEMKLKDEEWFEQMSIDLRLNTVVTKINMSRRRIFFANNLAPVIYSKLFIGTGSRGKLPSARLVPGVDLENVFTISNINEAQKVYKESKGKTVVIEGSGFVAMELVSTMKGHAKMCYIVTRQKRPFQTVLGETVGKVLQQHIVKQIPNLEFYTFDEIRQIIGTGKVTKVKTLKGKVIQCDVVVYAIGSVPNSELFAEDKRALIAKSGHIVVNEVSNNIGTFDDIYQNLYFCKKKYIYMQSFN